MKVMSTRAAAEKWGVQLNTVLKWIKRGKLPEAYKLDDGDPKHTVWLIPEDTERPEAHPKHPKYE